MGVRGTADVARLARLSYGESSWGECRLSGFDAECDRDGATRCVDDGVNVRGCGYLHLDSPS